jgi:hypothetical protein
MSPLLGLVGGMLLLYAVATGRLEALWRALTGRRER